MLDLRRMKRLELTANPIGQRVIAWGLLFPNYTAAPGVDIQIEGLDRIPSEPVVYAMNHTDRFNYWPFQYALYCRKDRYTATWVKGKYYQNPVIGKILEWTNNIPAVSKGYLIARDFLNVMNRKPTDEEYRHIRSELGRALEVRAPVSEVETDRGAEPTGSIAERRGPVPAPVYEQPRNILGMPYDPDVDTLGGALGRLYRAMMSEFVRLNESARRKGLDLLIFPEGTRSIQLSRGKVGMVQIALATDATVVPVGCNGSDELYPGSSPVAKSGTVTYRIGEPLGDEWRDRHKPDAAYEPFTPEAEAAHGEQFRAATDEVMAAINQLLDDKYRAPGETAADKSGISRFV